MQTPTGGPDNLGQRRQIFSSGLWIAASTTVPFLATAALSVVAGRVLGAELLGQQSLIAFAGQILAALVIASLTEACIRWLAAYRRSDPDRVPGLERWAMRLHLVAGAAAAVLLLVVGYLRGDFLTAWAIVAVTSLLDAAASGMASRVVARDGWSSVAQRRLLTQLVGVGLGILAVLMGFGIAGIFAGNAVGTLVLLALMRPLLTRPGTGSASLPRPVLKLWIVLAGTAVLSKIVSGRIEILFLGAYTTGEQIAQYTVAVMLVTAAITLPTGLAGAAMPSVAAASGAGEHARATAAMGRAMRISAVLALPLTALIVASGPSFIVALYGSDFQEAADLSRYVALLGLVVPCGRLARSYWGGVGLLRYPVIAGSVGAVLELGVAFALIPGLQARGAVLATLVGQGALAVLVTVLTWRRLRPGPVRLSAWWSSALASAAAAAAGTAAATAAAGISDLLGAVAGAAAAVLVFVLLASLLRLVHLPMLHAQDADWLRGALPARLRPLVRPLAAPRR